MTVFIYILEWVISFFVIWGLYYLTFFLFKKKFNPITAAIFTFIIVSLFVFLLFPYIISFPETAWVYGPSLFFWFIYYIYEANKQMS